MMQYQVPEHCSHFFNTSVTICIHFLTLAKIDHTLSLAHTHNLPTVTPTQVFNHLELAYRYGRLVPSNTSARDEYDKAFTIYLKSLVEGEKDRTREELKKCEQCSGT